MEHKCKLTTRATLTCTAIMDSFDAFFKPYDKRRAYKRRTHKVSYSKADQQMARGSTSAVYFRYKDCHIDHLTTSAVILITRPREG